MVTVTPIVSSADLVQTSPAALVYVSDSLREANFVLVPYLRCERLRVACGPEIDQCELSYLYGDIVREFSPAPAVSGSSASSSASGSGGGGPTLQYYPPLELSGKFVKVVIPDTVYADDLAAARLSSSSASTSTPDLTVTWYGRIEHDQRNAFGSGVTAIPSVSSTSSYSSASASTATHPRGEQSFTAFGLLRLLEQEVIDTSWVDTSGSTTSVSSAASLYEVPTGLPFNTDPGGQFVRRGNRSQATIDGSYVFSWQARDADVWTAYDAVGYLLRWQSPKQNTGAVANVWRLNADVDSLDWYDIDLPTNGKTVKSVIDALIPRQRAVGYWVSYDNTNDQIVLNVFTFSNVDIALPNGQTLEANPNQRSLNFEFALDVTEAVISETDLSKYHRIIARGDRRTNTFTARIQTSPSPTTIIHSGWSVADEQDYISILHAGSDLYSGSTEQIQKRCAIYRSSPKLEHVFRRFKLNQQIDGNRWNGSIADPMGNVSNLYSLRGDQSAVTYDPTYTSAIFQADYIPALRLRRALPLYEGVDASGSNLSSFSYFSTFGAVDHPSFLRPFVFAQTTASQASASSTSSTSASAAVTARYELLDKLHRSWNANGDRSWSASVSILDTEPGLELHANPPHFLAGNSYVYGHGSVASWLPETLSTTEDHTLNKGIDYNNCWATICVELTEHVQAEVVLAEPPDLAPEQVLILNVPEARFDFITPYTVVDIQDGLPVQTTSGGFAKNDMPRLKAIATAAAQWYSQERQTLELAYKQIRGLFRLGWLITDVGADYDRPGSGSSSGSSSSSSSGASGSAINTPITAITYDLGRGKTTGFTRLETGFAAFDLSDTARGV